MSNETQDWKGQILATNDSQETVRVKADSWTKSLKIITTDHSAIHNDCAFGISGIFAAVANGTTVNYAFKTPLLATGKMIHLKYKDVIATGNKIRVDLYESPTNAPTLGTDLVPYNRNRVGTTLTAMQNVKVGMTINLTGAVMIESAQFINNVPRSLDIEWILKPDMWYIRTFTNSTGAAADISFFEFWYEEEAE